MIPPRTNMLRKVWIMGLVALLLIMSLPTYARAFSPRFQTDLCDGPFISVSQPLNDLGPGEYIRLNTGPTGFIGGLYPNGSNVRPAAHEASGVEIASRIVPRNAAGYPDPAGKIVMISVGMSNTSSDFRGFVEMVQDDPTINPSLVLVNGAQPGKVATEWIDPQAETWNFVDGRLEHFGVTPLQVQAAWVKLTNYDLSDFPQDIQLLQSHLETVARNLKIRYPNVQIAYFSSRTRSYRYWQGLNPEPGAFETGFAVRWMIEKQINGDPALNYNPDVGPVVAPYLSWGAYLWIDGTNPRSDGMVWLQSDLIPDCTHPSPSGVDKVASQLMTFFKSDSTSRTWFLSGETFSPQFFLPMLARGLSSAYLRNGTRRHK